MAQVCLKEARRYTNTPACVCQGWNGLAPLGGNDLLVTGGIWGGLSTLGEALWRGAGRWMRAGLGDV